MTLTRGAQLALVVAFLYSLSTLTYKAATGVSDPFVAIFWEWLAYGVFGAVIAHGYLGKFREEFPKLGIPRIGFLLAVAAVVGVAYTALTYAYMLQSAALVSAVSSAQPLFVVFYALFATAAVPKLMKEELGRKTMAFKVLGGLLIILGVYLVS